MIRKVMKLNDKGSLGVGIPSKIAQELGWTADDSLNVVKVGNTLHITKVVLQ